MNIKCFNCQVEKEISEFPKNKYKKNGVITICKPCFKEKYRKTNEERKIYYENNKHKWSEYYLDNKETISEYKKKYREENSFQISEKQKIYVEKNKEILKIKWKKYRDNNKDNIDKWFTENVEYRKEYKKKYNSNPETKQKRNLLRKNRRIEDKLYQLSENLRSRIHSSLKSKGYNKNHKTEFILGCSCEEFKLYLESKFLEWMNWQNYGLYNGETNFGWDIDHIIPISSAINEEEILKLNHYTNLQPLCSKINRDIKSSKLI